MGTRVRMESRVVGTAGFWPGTPVGAQGSPGPRGEPGNTALFLSALRNVCVHTQEITLKNAPCRPRQPPSPVGHPGSGGESEPGCSRLLAWDPGGGLGPPGSPWRARQYGSFALRTWDIFAFVPRKSRQRLPLAGPATPPPSWVTRVRVESRNLGVAGFWPGTPVGLSPWRARQYGSFAVRT